MKVLLLLTLTLNLFWISTSGQNPWRDVDENTIERTGARQVTPANYRTVALDTEQFFRIMREVLHERQLRPSESTSMLDIPLPEGGYETFRIVEYAMMEEGLSSRYQDFRTFLGMSVNDTRRRIRIDWTARGFRAMIKAGEGTYFIDPVYVGNREAYQVYYRDDFRQAGDPFECHTLARNLDLPDDDNRGQRAGDCVFRSYRLVVATTGEYSNYHGADEESESGLVLSEVITAVNRVNGVYEADVTLRMILIANTDDVFFYNGATDPYSNGNGGAMLSQNQTTCDNVIGSSNYDIGHVFSTGGGGVASLAVPCANGSKARGVTGLPDPINDPFYIDYVAHEMGHQFGANHTQYNSCNRNNATAMEPGSASTIMGYAGICVPNVQPNSDAYFHGISVQEISNYISNGNGNSCDVPLSFANTAPSLDPVQDYTIPISTPFMLTAVATDAEGDSLSFCWEEWDNDGSATQPPAPTNTVGPMFRSLFATESPTRYFPNLPDLADNINPEWEELPSVSRDMEFRITVRDYHEEAGCTDEDNMFVTTSSSAGPFEVVIPNGSEIWTEVAMHTITWDVANTDQTPVSCAAVDILLSYDGGLTYPVTVSSDVPNTGSHEAELPPGTGTQCRIMVKGHDNIFFDISNEDFEIQPGLPGFYLTAENTSVGLCPPGDAVFEIEVHSVAGFAGPVIFSLSGFPVGSLPVFLPNPALPGDTVILTITNLAGVAPGTFDMTANAVAATGEDAVDLELIVHGSPGNVGLSIPENGQEDVELFTHFEWFPDEYATEYQIEVSRDNLFNIIELQEVSQDTSFDSPLQLLPDTTYYWRVKPANICDEGTWSEVWSFRTLRCATFHSTDVPVPITGSPPTPIFSTLDIPNDGAITDVNVIDLAGTHTWVGDLIFHIVSPAGTEVLLLEEICGNDNNFDFGFDDDSNTTPPCPPTDGGIHNPEGMLSDLNGQELSGTWMLKVEDGHPNDNGSLQSWGIEVCWEPGSCDPVVTALTNEGPGSLRDVLECAEEGATITFDPLLFGQTILLENDPIIVGRDISIYSPPATSVIIDGRRLDHVFEVLAGSTVTMEGVHILSGRELVGGGIRNWGNLILKDVSLEENSEVPNTDTYIINYSNLEIEGNFNILRNN